MERINTYEQWLEQEGIPVVRDYSVPDLMAVPLKPWARKGGLGAFINLIGPQGASDAYLCEIPPGKHLLPQRHVFDELIYILSGYGATTVWVEGGAKQTFEWQEGSLFSPPLNTWHQHFNGQSDKPVRYFAVTMAPVFMNLFHDLDFIFNNDFVFKNRYQGEEGYFTSRGRDIEAGGIIDNPKIWESNFIPDCRTFPLAEDPARGGNQTNIRFDLSNGLIGSHISELPGGTYMKAHYHNPGTYLLCLSGLGYELMWPQDKGPMAEGVERLKLDWKQHSVFAPVNMWYHQPFSTSKEPTRLLALEPDRSSKFRGIVKEVGARTSIKEGGNQIEFEDEDPAIRRQFKEEIAKTGAAWRMAQFFPGE